MRVSVLAAVARARRRVAARRSSRHRSRRRVPPATSRVPLQERRRADQRHRDGVRRERAVRARAAPGRLRRLRGRPAGRRHALQRRARAGQPGHRARHQRQHGRREDSRRRRAALDRFLYELLDRAGRDLPLSLQQPPGAAAGLDDAIASCCRARSAASRRTAARRCTTRSPRRCRWRSRGRTARRRCWSSPTATTRPARRRVREVKQQIRESEVLVYAIGIDGERATIRPAAVAAAGCRCRCRCRFPAAAMPGGRRATPPIFPRPAAGRRRRSAAANDDRVNVVALRDMTDDSGGRTEIVRDARDLESGDGEHRRRIEQAVLPRLSVDRKEGRPLAHDPRRSAQPRVSRARARNAAYVAS